MSQVKRDEDGKLWVAAPGVKSLLLARAGLAALYSTEDYEGPAKNGIAVIGNYLDWAITGENEAELVKLIDWAPGFVTAWYAIPRASSENEEALQAAFDLMGDQIVDIAKRLPKPDAMMEMKIKAEQGLK